MVFAIIAVCITIICVACLWFDYKKEQLNVIAKCSAKEDIKNKEE